MLDILSHFNLYLNHSDEESEWTLHFKKKKNIYVAIYLQNNWELDVRRIYF